MVHLQTLGLPFVTQTQLLPPKSLPPVVAMHPAHVRVAEVAKASAVITPEGARQLGIACEAAKVVLARVYLDILHHNEGKPVLSSKSCDGTPINVVHRDKVKLPSGKTVRATGKAAQ
eukprot:5939991-Lingulodinium_polyedra.AAC.1